MFLNWDVGTGMHKYDVPAIPPQALDSVYRTWSSFIPLCLWNKKEGWVTLPNW